MRDLFPRPRNLIGMVHVGALPGTPLSRQTPKQLIEQAVREAEILAAVGFDGVILENMHDLPYLKGQVGPEVVAVMACLCRAVKSAIALPLGVQILAGANQEALAVALAGGASFIRAEGFVFGHLADEGLMEACAGPLLRYRRGIGAEHIKVLCDLKKKHSSHALTADVSIGEMAQAAQFFLADGVVLTGTSTGKEAQIEELSELQQASDLPVWIGSGLTPKNLSRYSQAHGLIVGSFIKEDGDWRKPVNRERCQEVVTAFREQC